MDENRRLEIFKESINSEINSDRFLEILSDDMITHLTTVCNYTVPDFFISTIERLTSSGMSLEDAQLKTLYLIGITYFSWGYSIKDKINRMELEDLLNS